MFNYLSKISNASLKTRLLILIFIIIIEVGLVSVMININSRFVIAEYDERIKSIMLINDIKNDVNNGYNLFKEILISGSDEYEEKLIDVNKKIEIKMSSLAKLVGSNKGKLIFVDIDNIMKNFFQEYYITIAEVKNTDEIILQKVNKTFEYSQYLEYMFSELMSKEFEFNIAEYEKLKSNTSDLMNTALIILILICFVSIIYAINYSNDIYYPIQRLVKGASKLAGGDFSGEDINVNRDDEIGYLTIVFNKMKREILQYIKDNEDKARIEALLKDTELKALQSQINPHFLFNTLSMVTESALLGRNDETIDIVEEISYILRYSLTSFQNSVSIKDEIEMAKNYISLQTKRFRDRITFNLDIPDNIKDIEVPGMILQPIIENAILHGIEDKIDGGEICILLDENNESLIISVKDNGIGMDKKKINEIFSSERYINSEYSTGIGLNNVRERLKIFFDSKEELLVIRSILGKGTIVTIILPKK